MSDKKVLVDGVEYVRADQGSAPADGWMCVQLVGRFIYVGRAEVTDLEIVLRDVKIVRYWGGDAGLYVALCGGPGSGDLRLDDAGPVKVLNRAHVIEYFALPCDVWGGNG